MSALKIVHGNLLDLAESGEFNIIVHGCNCFCVMGAGIAGQIAKRFPHAYAADLQTTKGDRSKMGTYTVGLGKRFNIINAYTQYYPGNQGDEFEYQKLADVLASLASEYPTCNFGIPMIGCGIAGADPNRVMMMFEGFANVVNSTGGTVTLVKFQ